MKPSALLPIPLFAALLSCGGESPPAVAGANALSEPGQAAGLPPDEAIAGKVYDPDYSVPDGFFVDERAGTAQSYTVHHILDESGAYERCSDDFEAAAAWESADNASRSVSGYYVGAYENERYFEFIRELSYDSGIGNIDEPTSPGFARVFKCSNTNRDGVDRSVLSGYAGTLNVRPLAADQVRNFAEYFWQFSYFPQRHKKVLASTAVNSEDQPGHTLLLAFASGQGTGRCDRIDVVEWRFVTDAATGRTQTLFEVVRQFEAQAIDGSPRLCQ